MTRALLFTFFAALLLLAQFPTRQAYPGQARVTIRIRGEHAEPAGVRLRVTDEAGEYFAPLGHLPQPDPSRRMSGDLLLGDGTTSPREVYAYVYDGQQIDLPPGRYTFHARKKFEYEPVRQQVDVSTEPTQTISLQMRKFEDFESKAGTRGTLTCISPIHPASAMKWSEKDCGFAAYCFSKAATARAVPESMVT